MIPGIACPGVLMISDNILKFILLFFIIILEKHAKH